jgi:hypothetical protein
MPAHGCNCTYHGHGSRQASSNEVKEHYHSNVHSRKRNGKEKLYSHENECKSMNDCLEHPMVLPEIFFEVNIEFIQTVQKSMQCKRIE